MMAPGFKPVGWVAAVGGAALGCYMLSLNVASERAELARVERQIIATKSDIRSLQTELGTRGRMAQLEQWNAEVLALSAPASGQFLDNEMKLARFDQRGPTLEERATVRMAAVEVKSSEPKKIEAPVIRAVAGIDSSLSDRPMVRRASLMVGPPKPLQAKPLQAKPLQPGPLQSKVLDSARPLRDKKPVEVAEAPRAAKPANASKSMSRLGDKLAREISAAARVEAGTGGQ
ncbi:MAG: hypothetical protein JWN69_511 [Alphaproteobacteria bacterium]|nr:hypothetical protein [Alphaproteobacteria bacterium]